MNRNYFLIIAFIAIACIFLIFFSVGREINSPLTKDPTVVPSVAPYKTSISGVGIVEPKSGNIYIGTMVNRIVEKIDVSVGSKVHKNEILLRLEDRDLQASLNVEKAAYISALARVKRLDAFPRKEDVSIAQAELANAKIALDLAKSQYEMVKGLPDPRAISEEERNRRLYNYQQAEARWEQADAEAKKVEAGTWGEDLEIAKLEVVQAQAEINRIQTEIDRTVIRSPIDGAVLQIKVHEGELPPQDTLRSPLMILGDIDELYVRVSINQFDIPLFNPTASAVAFVQDDSSVKFPLQFVRVEPYLVSKQNLTNDINEKIDTRVLQVIYKFAKTEPHIYVGQQMDVFIDAVGKYKEMNRQ